MLTVLLLLIAFTLTEGSLVAGQYYGGPGGQVSGFVYGTNGGGYDWAEIFAKNGNGTFQAFSGMSGFYLMRLPAGVYTLSVYTPGLPLGANSATITVTDNSSLTVNFQLQQEPVVATPEFQTNLSVLVMALVFSVAIAILKKGTKRVK